MWSPWVGLGLLLFALPMPLWPGLALGASLFGLLRRSRYRDGLLWFAAVPGLYLLTGGGGLEEQLERFTRWGLLSGALALWGHVWGRMLAGERRAALWLGPLLLLQPGGLLLGGLVGLHGLYTLERERRVSREVGRGFGMDRRAGVGLGVGLALVALAVSFLPLPRFVFSTQPAAPPAVTQPAEEPTPQAVQPAAPQKRTVRVAANTPFARFARSAAELLLTGILLLTTVLMAVLLWMALRERSSGKLGASRGSLTLLAVGLTWGLLLYWFVLGNANRGEGGGLTSLLEGLRQRLNLGAAPSTEVVETNQDLGYALVLLGALLVFLVLAGALALLLRSREPQGSPGEEQARAAYRIGGWQAGPPANRVRRAYYNFLHAMESRGQAKHFFESPREYARRLGLQAPPLHSSLQELTALYEPVRYGNPSDERQAERAEFLAREIPRHFPQERNS